MAAGAPKKTDHAGRGRLFTSLAISFMPRMSAFIHCCLSLRVVRAAVRSLKLPRSRSVLQRYAQHAVMDSWPV